MLRPQIELGGVTSYLAMLSREMIARGHSVMMLTTAISSNADSEDQLRLVGVTVLHGQLFPSTLLNIVRGAVYVTKLVRRLDIDVLHSHHRFTTIIGHIVGRLTGKPLVVTVHEFKQNWRMLAPLWTGTVTITPSRALKQHLVRYYDIPETRIHVVPHALLPPRHADEEGSSMLRRRFGLDPNMLYVCCVGRLAVEKGIRYFVESIPLVSARVTNVGFLVVGNGPLRDELEQQVRELGLTTRVHFLGARSDVPLLLKAVDVVVIPSLAESFALVALEAMRAGRPVVATDVGGIPEVVRNGQTGVLVPPSSGNAIANAVSWLLTDADVRQRLGSHGRQVADTEYSPARVAEQMLEVYRKAIVPVTCSLK